MPQIGKMEERVHILPKSIWVIMGFVVLTWVLYHTYKIIFLALLACVLAAALYPPINWFHKKHIPKPLIIIAIYLILITVFTSALFLLGNVIAEQMEIFIYDFPHYVEAAIGYLNALPMITINSEVINQINETLSRFLFQSADVFNTTIQYIGSFFSWIIGLIIVFVLTFHLINDASYFRDTVIAFFPPHLRTDLAHILETAADKTGAYVRGQLILMTTMGILVWLGLTIIGVPHANVIGFLYFLLDIVPIIGPIIGATVGTLVALAQDPLYGLWTLLYFIAIEQLENYILVPNILGHSVRIHPFWILLNILIFGTLFGIIGVLLAVPFTVLIRLVLEQFYLKQQREEINNQPLQPETSTT